MINRRHITRKITLSVAVLACLVLALPLLAQYDEWLQKARQAYQAGNYEQCINNCKIYSSMNGSTNKNELQVKAERMLACKAAGTLNAYRYMVQYNPNDSWAKEQLQKALATGDDYKFYVFFLPEKWDFDGSQSAIIDDIAAVIKRDDYVYQLVGYQEYGMASNKLDRTRRVKKALVEKGIAPNRLEDNSFSFGSLAANDETHFLTEAVIIEKTSNKVTTASTTTTKSSSVPKTSVTTKGNVEKAQDVVGFVTDAEGQPLIGATVRGNGAKTAATNLDGSFKLYGKDKIQMLEINYIGYEPLQLKTDGFKGYVVLHEYWPAGKNSPLVMGISSNIVYSNGCPNKITIGCIIKKSKTEKYKSCSLFL